MPDIAKARQVLGWEPRVPLDKGLRRTVQYFSINAAPASIPAGAAKDIQTL
jgi:nucleoside-diphosphate-sugar epimerase